MMKLPISTFALSLLFVASSLNAALRVGEPAPDFTLTDTAGVEHSLSDFAGQYVVLEWTNHKCPYVKKHYSEGHMQALQQELTESGAVWLQIVSSAAGEQGFVTAEEGEELRESKEMYSTAMLLDASGDVGRAYDARTTPHMFLISPEGDLLYQGAIDSNSSARTRDIAGAENYLKAAFESASAGEPIENSTTEPYGCSVKY